MEKSGKIREIEQNLSGKIRENQGFFILNIGGNPAIWTKWPKFKKSC